MEERREDDLALAQRCVAGDVSAWRQFLQIHQPAIERSIGCTLARGGRNNPDEVEEVRQAFLAALYEKDRHKLSTFRGECSLRGWIIAVAARFTINHLRYEGVRRTVELPEVQDRAPEAERLPPAEVERLHRALEALPPQDALILKLFHFEGLSYGAISKIVGIPLNTLCPRVARARMKLKSILLEIRH